MASWKEKENNRIYEEGVKAGQEGRSFSGMNYNGERGEIHSSGYKNGQDSLEPSERSMISDLIFPSSSDSSSNSKSSSSSGRVYSRDGSPSTSSATSISSSRLGCFLAFLGLVLFVPGVNAIWYSTIGRRDWEKVKDIPLWQALLHHNLELGQHNKPSLVQEHFQEQKRITTVYDKISYLVTNGYNFAAKELVEGDNNLEHKLIYLLRNYHHNKEIALWAFDFGKKAEENGEYGNAHWFYNNALEAYLDITRSKEKGKEQLRYYKATYDIAIMEGNAKLKDSLEMDFYNNPYYKDNPKEIEKSVFFHAIAIELEVKSRYGLDIKEDIETLEDMLK